MNYNRGEKIMQMLPADGWQAVFSDYQGRPSMQDLICFALVETKEGKTEIRGVSTSASIPFFMVDNAVGFLGYNKPKNEFDIEDWRDIAKAKAVAY